MPKSKTLPLFSQVSEERRIPSTLIFSISHNRFIEGIHSLLEYVLLKIARTSKCDRAVILMLDPLSSSLFALKVYAHGQVMDGEEKIVLESSSPLQKIIYRKSRWLSIGRDCTYFLLHSYKHAIGVLRLEKQPSLKLSLKQKEQIAHFLEEASASIWNFLLHNESKEQSGRLKVLSEIHNSISHSLNVEELLMETAKTIQNVFGMDQIKFYLLGGSNQMLFGQIACNFRSEVSWINDEAYPLQPGAHPAVDALLHVRGKKSHRLSSVMRAIPLQAREENLGVLLVDNLLSQEELPEENMALLEMVSGQIGLAIKNAGLYQKVKELSITDGLTGLYLPRYFHQRFREEFSRAVRQKTPISLAIIDLDYFKEVNDTGGHIFGDKVLRLVSTQIVSSIRKFDIAVRYGGDEFIILLPGSSEKDTLYTAERIRKLVQASPIALDQNVQIKLSLSVGIASFPAHALNDEELLRRADHALYEAKKGGRNRVVIYGTSESEQGQLPGTV